MNCEQAREALIAEPRRRTAALNAHLAECRECSALAARLEAFESRLHRALSVPVPATPQTRVALPSPRLPRWFALAASGLLAAVALAVVLSVYPRQALAVAVANHVAHEPDSWSAQAAVADGELAAILRRSGARLEPGGPPVSYAQSCWFRGWFVPHLVVQTETGPVTLMLLAHETVARETPIDEGGYRGVIVPAGRGAIAVVARAGSDARPEAVAAAAARAVHFAN